MQMKIKKTIALFALILITTVIFLPFCQVEAGPADMPPEASFDGPPSGPADGTDPVEEDRIFDYGELFTGDEYDSLNEKLNAASLKYHVDFIILTTRDNPYKDPVKYTAEFYDSNYGLNQDFVIITIDMDTRNFYTTSVGIARYYVYDQIQSAAYQSALPYLKEDDFFGAAAAGLMVSQMAFDAGVPEDLQMFDIEKGEGITDRYTEKYDKTRKHLSPLGIFVSLLGGAGLGAGNFAVTRHRYKNPRYKAYRTPSNFVNVADNSVVTGTRRVYVGSVSSDSSSSSSGGGGSSSSSFSSGGGSSMSSGGGGF